MWTIAWPLYSRVCRGERGERVVGDGDDDQLDLLDEGLRLGERPGAAGQAGQPLAPGRIAAGDRLDRPAGPGQGEGQRAADRAAADDARWSGARPAPAC